MINTTIVYLFMHSGAWSKVHSTQLQYTENYSFYFFLFSLFEKYLFSFLFLHICVYVYHMCEGAHGGQNRVLVPLELVAAVD